MPVIGRPTRRRTLCGRLFGNDGDRGAVAVIVALLLGSGVLLGMAALVVDVGNLYAERRQLQGGADAAAIKVAQVCAGPTGCSAASINVDQYASDYANDNANDKSARATVCGRGGSLSPCPSPVGQITDCIGPAPGTADYVEVHTITRNSDGTTALPPVFAQAVLGGFDGVEVAACARVAWGPPARANGLAMTISICDWKVAEGRAFAAEEQFFPEYDEKAPGACGVAGTDIGNAGGFRWLADADPNCRAMVAVSGSYGVRPGNSGTPGGCGDALTGVLEAGRPVLLPVFDAVSGSGGGADYTIHGFAAFVVTGWRLPGSATRPSCDNGASSCIYGYFTEAVVPGSGALGGPDLGAQIISLIG